MPKFGMCVFVSLGYIPGIEIAGLYVNSMFTFSGGGGGTEERMHFLNKILTFGTQIHFSDF